MTRIPDDPVGLLPVVPQDRKAASRTSWPVFAAKLKWQRGHYWPGCVPMDETETCPRHSLELGSISSMCLDCHHEAWAWTAEKFLAARSRTTDRRTA